MPVKNRTIKSNLRKIDSHVISAEEYDEIPELPDDFFERAEFSIRGVVIRPANGTLTKPGRPKSAAPKQSVHLRLSPDVLAHFRETGPGWQTRIDETLRKAAKLKARKA